MTFLLLDVAPILLIALPMTLVIITGEIDLSVASTVALSSVILGRAARRHGLADRPAAGSPSSSPRSAARSTGSSSRWSGCRRWPSRSDARAVPRHRRRAPRHQGNHRVPPGVARPRKGPRISAAPATHILLVPIAVLAVLYLLVLLHFTAFGRGVYAIGLSHEAAGFSGVGVERTKFLPVRLAGFIAAFAGIYYTLRFGSSRGNNAKGTELKVIAAVLLGGVSIFGGRGTLPGVIAGALLIGVISSASGSRTRPPMSSRSSSERCSCSR